MTPIFGQQQSNSYSLPMGGNNFMRANQIGGPSRINVFRMPQSNPQLNAGNQSSLRSPGATFGQSSLRPPGAIFGLGESSFEDRAEKYQQDLAEFNLGQREDELAKRISDTGEIESGRFMIDGRAVTSAEKDQYERNTREQKQEEQQTLSDLTSSLFSLRRDPNNFFRSGRSAEELGQLTSFLGQANQLLRASGREGNVLDFVLGNRRYIPGSSYASQGFTEAEAKASMGLAPSRQDEMRQFNLRTFQRAAPGTDFPSMGGSQMGVTGVMGQSPVSRPAVDQSREAKQKFLGEQLARLGLQR